MRAVIAESFERIHRSNLVGMGVLPLQFKAGENAESLGLTGSEELTIRGLAGELRPRQDVTVDGAQPDGTRCQLRGRSRASTRRSRSTTTATAASCTRCCARWRGDGASYFFAALTATRNPMLYEKVSGGVSWRWLTVSRSGLSSSQAPPRTRRLSVGAPSGSFPPG